MHDTQYAWSDRMLAEAVLAALHEALRLPMSTCMPTSCLCTEPKCDMNDSTRLKHVAAHKVMFAHADLNRLYRTQTPMSMMMACLRRDCTLTASSPDQGPEELSSCSALLPLGDCPSSSLLAYWVRSKQLRRDVTVAGSRRWL